MIGQPGAASHLPMAASGIYMHPQQLSHMELPEVVHVPVFRQRKRIYVKKQYEGCCGSLNTTGYFDNPGGLLPWFNIDGCCDRDLIYRVDSEGNALQSRAATKRQWRHPWEKDSEASERSQ